MFSLKKRLNFSKIQMSRKNYDMCKIAAALLLIFQMYVQDQFNFLKLKIMTNKGSKRLKRLSLQL